MTMSNRKFGIEIECTGMSMDAAATVINSTGLICGIERYGHAAPRNWKIVPDGSVPDGFEVVSPILSGEDGLTAVRTVARALLAAGAKVDKRCGLHVHVDARDLSGADLVSVVKRYAAHESQIDAFMPVSRRLNNNQFCRSMCDWAENYSSPRRASWTPTRLAEEMDCRYYKVNLQSFVRHGSVEFRQHSGTIDSRKMENWIQFCLNFVEHSKITVNRVEEAPDSSPQRANAIEKKFAKLAELFDIHNDRYSPISSAEIARALETTESTVVSYISQFRARYSAVIKVRRNRGYYKEDRRCLRDVVGVASPTITTTIVVPEERGVFYGLSVEVASYFHERIQDLSQERTHAAPGRSAGRAQRYLSTRLSETRAAQPAVVQFSVDDA